MTNPEQVCPICGAGSHRTTLRLDPEIPILVCPACGHAVRAEAPSFDANIAQQIEVARQKAVPASPRDVRWPRRVALVAAQVRKLAGRHGAALDIGCGNGAWLLALGTGWTRFGVEVSPASADVVRRSTGAEVFRGPFESYRPQHPFDLITAFALIEHLGDPRAMIQWARDHLRPSGLLVLMTGDRQSAVARSLEDRWSLYAPPEHVSFFSAQSLRLLLEQTGFQVVRQEWRHMGHGAHRSSRVRSLWWKCKEVLGLVRRPYFDHYYCYARLPSRS